MRHQQWEYDFYLSQVPIERDDALVLLNHLGKQGWELVYVSGWLNDAFLFYLKRQVPSGKD